MNKIILIPPQCLKCKQYNVFKYIGVSCKAFPNGIPEQILSGKHDHTKPFKDDNGILFEEGEASDWNTDD